MAPSEVVARKQALRFLRPSGLIAATKRATLPRFGWSCCAMWWAWMM